MSCFMCRKRQNLEKCENSSHKYFTNVLPARQRTTPHCLCQSLYCGALACPESHARKEGMIALLYRQAASLPFEASRKTS